MPKICYVEKRFRSESRNLIDKINSVIIEYQEQGYSLTLRQCYYQLVARGFIPNNEKSYKNTGNLINDARLAGLIDWNSIEDRTRNLKSLSHWDDPRQIITAGAEQYRNNLWDGCHYYVEVWVEKEALSNIVARVADQLDVPYFCCRGYVSQSEMWQAAERFKYMQDYDKHVVLIHLGDHDPSGIDMSRDIKERLELFGVDQYDFTFTRIALNMEQVKEFNPPPNPAKITDSRCSSYIQKYGNNSWELDALEPQVIHDLITHEVGYYADEDLQAEIKRRVEREKHTMRRIVADWPNLYRMYNSN